MKDTRDMNKAEHLTVAAEMVDAIIEEGIEYVFGMTGNTILPILEEIYQRRDELKYITCKSEVSMVNMASACSRVTGKVGCIVSHVGPAASNAVLGLWMADKATVPLLVITGNMDRYRLGRNIYHEFDVVGVYGKITKWNDQLVEPKDARRLMRTGLQMAKSGLPGPVHIDVPKDQFVKSATMEKTYDRSLAGSHHNEYVCNASRPTGEVVEKAMKMLMEADNPLVISGRSVVWAGADKELVEFAELVGIPVVTHELGRGSIPEDHPLAGGLMGHYGRTVANSLVRKADVLLGLGCQFDNVCTISWTLPREDVRIIQIENEPLEIGRQYAVALGAVADSGEFLKDAIAWCKDHGIRKPEHVTDAYIADIAGLKAEEQDLIDEHYDLSTKPVCPMLIPKVATEVFADDVIVGIGSGYHTHYGHHVHVKQSDQYLFATGSGSMCYGFAAGLGAKLARPDREVVVFIGDGDFGMNAQELETAVRENLAITVVVFDDCSYGALRVMQKRVHEGRYIGSHFGPTDFVKLAESYGARGELVEEPEQLKPAMERARDADVCSVIQVKIDQWQYHHRAPEWADFHRFEME